MNAFGLKVLIIVFLSASSFGLSSIYVNTETNQLTDVEGRSRIFHGVNVVEKSVPYYPIELLTNERMDLLEEWGFNVVRLVSLN